VTYTVTVTNSGTSPFTDEAPAIVTDDLSGLLDDATFDGDASASDGEVTFDEPRLTWTGALAPDAVVTITYAVTLTGAGDTVISNVAFQPNCDPADEDCQPVTPPVEPCAEGGVDPETGLPCDATTLDLPKLSVQKTADTTAIPEVGQTVTYTVTATNVGKGGFTAEDPAAVIDELTGVLDDATIDPASVQADREPAAQYAEPRVTWSGALAPGETVTITYRVTYTGAGDHKLINVAFAPADPENPVPPTCDPADENGLDPETGQPCARNQIPAAGLVVTKSVDPADGGAVKAGQQVTYTITFANDGAADAAVTKWIDDLSGVLDDAELIADPKASDESLTLSEIAAGRFTVDGTVPAGETVSVTYTVRVLADGERGDNLLGNVVGQNPQPGTPCAENDPLCTSNPIAEIVDSKSVDPESGTAVKPGQQVHYTLTFHNGGTAAGMVDRVDDLNHLVDDADLTTPPTASDPALSVSELDDGRIKITGEVPPGQTITVSYTATIRGLDELGDGTLANFLLDPDQKTPLEPVCEGDDCTVNEITRLSVTKAADPESGTTVAAGERITYTLTFRNDGNVDAAVDHTDHLAGVVDDARVVEYVEASDPALTVLDSEDQYTVQGTLTAGQTVTVSYVVEVRAVDDQGDGVLANFVTETGAEAPKTCDVDDPACTSHPIEGAEPTLPDTGAPSVLIALIGGLVLLTAGGIVIGRRLRKGGSGQES
jgi:fimbrial isopeptide formation D2 family protein/LPXTG-motif cell wall-anchored protein